MKKKKSKLLWKNAPKVALLLESSHESSRGMIRGVLKYARHNGDWQIELVHGGPNDLYLPDLSVWKGDGALGRIRNEMTAQIVLSSKLPFVLVDPETHYLAPESPFYAYSSVSCDSVAVARLAAEHLTRLGFESYAYVGDVVSSVWSITRERAFCDEIENRGLSCAVYPIPPVGKRTHEAEESRLVRWLKNLQTPVGIFASNDQRGVQLLHVCRLAGLRVPYDAAVLGVNNDELVCRTTRPELSSVGLDSEFAGYEAARILDERMRGIATEREIVTFGPTEVFVRGSTRGDTLKNVKVVDALDFIRVNAGCNISVSDVARHVGLSRQWIGRLFLKERGRTIYDEIQIARNKVALRMIEETDMPISKIGKRCGFVDGKRLNVLFRRHFGMSPSKYREQCRRATEHERIAAEDD